MMADPSHKPTARIVLCLLLAMAGAMQGWLARSQTSAPADKATSLPEQIAQHEQKLAEARALQDLKDETTELNALGTLYRQTGQRQKALDDCNEALPIERSVGNRVGEAVTLTTLGRI